MVLSLVEFAAAYWCGDAGGGGSGGSQREEQVHEGELSNHLGPRQRAGAPGECPTAVHI